MSCMLLAATTIISSSFLWIGDLMNWCHVLDGIRFECVRPLSRWWFDENKFINWFVHVSWRFRWNELIRSIHNFFCLHPSNLWSCYDERASFWTVSRAKREERNRGDIRGILHSRNGIKCVYMNVLCVVEWDWGLIWRTYSFTNLNRYLTRANPILTIGHIVLE